MESGDEIRHYIRQDRKRESTLFLCSPDQSILLKDFLSQRISFSFNSLHIINIFYSLPFICLSHCSCSHPNTALRCQICYLFMENRSLATSHKAHSVSLCKETPYRLSFLQCSVEISCEGHPKIN